MRVNLVVAMATNRVIGRAATLPWHLPSDLKHFKKITLGYPLIMGRVTHQSIGRALPGRLNIVVSGNLHAAAAGCVVVASLADALSAAAPAPEAMVIGGHALYHAALPTAQRIFLTEVHAEIEGDVTFPPFAHEEWRETSREDCAADEQHAYPFSFVILERAIREP
jgi:dihydrofolate reductase